jgi:hypothetical protein
MNKTEEEYIEMVEKDIEMLEYVPAELRTIEVCLAAIKQSPFRGLRYTPHKFREEIGRRMEEMFEIAEECLKIVGKSGKMLCCVPAELRTLEISVAAVKEDVYALKYVPEGLQAAVERRLKEEAGE